jgi:hypothetical protein
MFKHYIKNKQESVFGHASLFYYISRLYDQTCLLYMLAECTVKKEDAVSICNGQLVVMWRINVPSYVMYKIYIAPKQEETNLLIVGVISE